MPWMIVLACLVCQIGMGLGAYLFPVFLKPVAEDLGWSRTTYAAAQPLMSAAVALAGPLVGRLADRDARPVLAFGGLLMSVVLLLAGGMNTPGEFYAIAIGVGVAVACLGDLPTSAVIAPRLGRHRGLALGMVFVGSNIGGAVGPLLATSLAAGGSWRAGFSGIGSVLWIFLLPAAFAIGRPLAKARERPAEARVRPAEARERPAEARVLGVSPRAALGSRDFWMIAWALFAFYFYRIGINTHLVAWLSDLGYSDGAAAAQFSAMIGIGLAGKLVAGAFADRIGVRPAVLVNFSLLVAASVLLLLPQVPGAIGLFLLLHGLASAAEDVVVPLLVGQRFGTLHLSAIYGLLLLALVPGGAAGPLIAGWIFDSGAGYGPVFFAFVIANLSAVLALASVGRGAVRRADLVTEGNNA